MYLIHMTLHLVPPVALVVTQLTLEGEMGPVHFLHVSQPGHFGAEGQNTNVAGQTAFGCLWLQLLFHSRTFIHQDSGAAFKLPQAGGVVFCHMICQVVKTLGGELALGADEVGAHLGDSLLNVRVEVGGHRGGGGPA